MYITQELFGSPYNSSHFESSSPHIHTWNTMTIDSPPDHQSLGKRKRCLDLLEGPNVRPRHAEEDDHAQYPQDANRSQSTTTCGSRSPMKISPETASSKPSNLRPTKNPRRLVFPKKVTFQKQASFQMMDVEPENFDPTSNLPQALTFPTKPPTTTNLQPCHICKKAPKRKSDLDNYLECSRCIGRTCFICVRNCVKCHKDLCSTCCKEIGEDGDTWCRDCLPPETQVPMGK